MYRVWMQVTGSHFFLKHYQISKYKNFEICKITKQKKAEFDIYKAENFGLYSNDSDYDIATCKISTSF